jgi:arylsulfatase A
MRPPTISRLTVLLLACAALTGPGEGGAQQPARGRANRPNVIVIFTDDQGYGDLGAYGHPTIRTPNLDRMAAEGLKFTQFYASAPVCTPSRAGLMTGRLPVRSGMAGGAGGVLHPFSSGGLPQSEITIAEALKAQGYATGMVGKWHLGHLPQYLPTRNGFDSWLGIPYSNDMDRVGGAAEYVADIRNPDLPIERYQVPLMRDEQIIERPADQNTITRRYTQEAVRFIRTNRGRPFFLYLAHAMPHLPLFASDAFRGKSPRGLYGDVIEELDWSVGQVLQTLRELDLDERTLVIFTSDNGPWTIFGLGGGSAGLLRGGKGSTWEGGVRVPAIAWWPGTIAPRRVTTALASNMDVFPTAMELTGGTMPRDREIDGVSLMPVLRGQREQVREVLYYYQGSQLYAIRKGPWKAHLTVPAGQGAASAGATPPKVPQLYDLDADPSEQFDVAAQHPEVIAELQREAERHRATVKSVPSQLDLPRIPTTLEQRPK